jgi:hypothetical protein
MFVPRSHSNLIGAATLCSADTDDGKHRLALTTRGQFVTQLTRCVAAYELGRRDRCLTITDLMTVVRTGVISSADS